MHAQTELKFYWKRKEIKEAIFAVTKAVAAGYNTRDTLLAALPQFSKYRIALAIDALITADMAANNLGVLTIHPDMDIVFELVKRPFVLPLTVADANARGVRRMLINRLGCNNPAGVDMLLKTKTFEA